jgi:hypothetical protein
MQDNGEYEVDEVYIKRVNTYDGSIVNKWILGIYERRTHMIFLKP